MSNLSEKYKSCENSAATLFERLKRIIDNGSKDSDGYAISAFVGQFEYDLNTLLGKIFPDEVRRDISDGNRLNKACHYLNYVLRRLDHTRDEGVFWIKSGSFEMEPHFLGKGVAPDYEIVGDLILSRMDEIGDDDGEYIRNLVSYLNDRMANNDWRE